MHILDLLQLVLPNRCLRVSDQSVGTEQKCLFAEILELEVDTPTKKNSLLGDVGGEHVVVRGSPLQVEIKRTVKLL